MNCIPPQAGFLKALRTLCTGAGSLLLLDEVMTGFRVALGGAQSLYDVRPDLTILGKVIGGGLPVGAFGGREDIMAHLAPDGPVYQAGTLSGNPVAMSAGLATLDCVSKPGFFAGLEENCKRLTAGVTAAALECGVAMTSHTVGGMFGLFFSDLPVVTNFAETMACDQVRFRRFFHGMLERGIYLAPSPFEAGFISSAHTDDHLNRTIDAARETLQSE